MEDRYLFKAKRIDNGEWVYGSYVYTFCEDKNGIVVGVKVEKHWIVEESGNMVWADKDTICQCTGLKDKNGNLIWENDIVGLYNENKEERYAVGSVEYGTFNCSCCDGVYGWYFTDSADIRDSERYEVIGNIFDNAGLLESEG